MGDSVTGRRKIHTDERGRQYVDMTVDDLEVLSTGTVAACGFDEDGDYCRIEVVANRGYFTKVTGIRGMLATTWYWISWPFTRLGKP